MSNSKFDFDDSEWPLLTIRFSGSPTDEEYEAYLNKYETYLERPERYGLVVVTEPNTPMTKPRHAKMQATWIRDNYDRLAAKCVGISFVMPGPMMRGVIKAILAMQSMPMEHSVYSKELDSREWVKGKLQADRRRKAAG